jgi:hypothetical protein
MGSIYRHTQTGQLMSWAIVLTAIGLFIAGHVRRKGDLVLADRGDPRRCWLDLFVTHRRSYGDRIDLVFRSGLLAQKHRTDEIVSATPVRNKWWWGWGIHLTPRGWLYNVAGLEGVEIALSNGRTLRVGSDEALALANALSQH